MAPFIPYPDLVVITATRPLKRKKFLMIVFDMVSVYIYMKGFLLAQ